MKFTPRFWTFLNYLGIICLFSLGILARSNLSNISRDMQTYVIPWYDYIRSKGILLALGKNFSNYTPPYTYLLALMTLTSTFIPKVIAIKIISILADIVNSFLVYKIVRLNYPSGLMPLWATGIFLCLPSVFANSAIWGQVDAVYTVFLLSSLYFFLQEKPFQGMLAYSVSFAFKAQAVFLAPFLIVLLFKNRIHAWHFILVPFVYVILCLPVVLLGRSWSDVLTIYYYQGVSSIELSSNAPNLYIFLANRYNQAGVWIGLLFALIGISIWILLTVLDKKSLSSEKLVLTALVSLALLPFLLPKMHDRYFYPADVFSLVIAFFLPELWFVPLAYQGISGIAYTVYLSPEPANIMGIAVGINLFIIIVLLLKQFRTSSHPRE